MAEPLRIRSGIDNARREMGCNRVFSGKSLISVGFQAGMRPISDCLSWRRRVLTIIYVVCGPVNKRAISGILDGVV